MESILVAAVAAIGVIGSAFIQWRSNVATIRAAEKREEATRADRERAQAIAFEEQSKIREEERAVRRNEANSARYEYWRSTRTKIYEQATQIIIDSESLITDLKQHTLIAQLGAPKGAFSQSFHSKIAEVKTDFTTLFESGWVTVAPDIQLYASDDASSVFDQLKREFARIVSLIGVFQWHDGMAEKWIDNIQQSVDLFLQQQSGFISSAKSDLDTR